MELKPPHDLNQPWYALGVSMVFWGLFFTVLRTGKTWRNARPLIFWTVAGASLTLGLYFLGLFFHLQPRI